MLSPRRSTLRRFSSGINLPSLPWLPSLPSLSSLPSLPPPPRPRAALTALAALAARLPSLLETDSPLALPPLPREISLGLPPMNLPRFSAADARRDIAAAAAPLAALAPRVQRAARAARHEYGAVRDAQRAVKSREVIRREQSGAAPQGGGLYPEVTSGDLWQEEALMQASPHSSTGSTVAPKAQQHGSTGSTSSTAAR